MKIAYVAASWRQGGPRVQARSLMRHLRLEHVVSVLGAVVGPDSPLLSGDLSRFVRTGSSLDATVLFFEGGWPQSGPQKRGAYDEIMSFAEEGGVVVISDMDYDVSARAYDEIKELAPRLQLIPRFGPSLYGTEGIRALYEEAVRNDDGAHRFHTSEMFISDWLKPAMEGIDSLLVWGPTEWWPGDGVAASGQRTTKILVLDTFADEGYPWPWAVVREVGLGYVLVIGGDITGDVWIDECPDNARWLSRIIALLADRASENKAWLGDGSDSKSPRKMSLPTDLDQIIKLDESHSHERKGSFITSLKNPNIPKEKVQLQVTKAIAALANASGGTLVIGQADGGEVLGLADDFERLHPERRNRDGFELLLAEFVDDKLSIGWINLGLSLAWVEIEGKDLALIDVPRSSEPVWQREDRGADVLYVRRTSGTKALTGVELSDWIKRRHHP